MDKREALKSMLSNLINDKREEATLDLHTYLTTKMKDVAGLSRSEETSNVETELDIENDVENDVEETETETETPSADQSF